VFDAAPTSAGFGKKAGRVLIKRQIHRFYRIGFLRYRSYAEEFTYCFEIRGFRLAFGAPCRKGN
jgi:hypothetical protein